MSEFTLEPLEDYPQRERVLALAAEHADAVDAGERSPFENLREIAKDGLLTLGRTGSLLPQVSVAFDLASQDATTGFSLWAHRSTIAFFDAVNRELPEGLAEATTSGTSAMAAAYKEASGLAPIKVLGTLVEGGVKLNGTVSWASNLYPGGVIVLPVAVQNAQEGHPNRYIVTVRQDVPGLKVVYHRNLLALNGTESGTIIFEDVFVPTEDILTDNFEGFLNDVTAPFLLVQSAFCLGIAAGALVEASKHLEASQGIFSSEFPLIVGEYESLRDELVRLAREPQRAERRDLLSLRLGVSHLATIATHFELQVVGGAGYVASSPTARRLREASFLPVQSPTEGHLRFELSKYDHLEDLQAAL